MSDSGEDAAEVPPNAADPKSARESRRRGKEAERDALAFWQTVFADPIGRKEMWDILEYCHTFRMVFGCGGRLDLPQAEASWVHAGEQSVGMHLFRQWMGRAPDNVLLMMREHDPKLRARSQKKVLSSDDLVAV